jgi:DNA-binding HxlR family transcriptional regulator
MTQDQWKLVVDQQGVTIANGQFRLTANGPNSTRSELLSPEDALAEVADSGRMEAIISQLQTVTRRNYGQFCGLSRALEMVGERWALLIIRDLLVSPKSVADLRRGFPRIPDSTLTTRLAELERSGIVRTRTDTSAPDSPVYELTPYGGELEEIVCRFALWGAQRLGDPRPEDVVTVDSAIMAMRSTFRAEAARGLRANFELRLPGEMIINARVADGAVAAGAGPLPDADLVVEPGTALKDLLTGELKPADALDDGTVRITGDPALLDRFVEVFRIPELAPAPLPA